MDDRTQGFLCLSWRGVLREDGKVGVGLGGPGRVSSLGESIRPPSVGTSGRGELRSCRALK